MSESDSNAGDGLEAHEQRAWDAIVADLSGQVDLGPAFRPDPSAVAPVAASTQAESVHPDDAWLDEGYVPPEPEPIPRPRDVIAKAAWAGALGGPTALVLAWVLGWESWLTGLAVAATVAGFVGLIARMPRDRDDDPGNGAVV